MWKGLNRERKEGRQDGETSGMKEIGAEERARRGGEEDEAWMN